MKADIPLPSFERPDAVYLAPLGGLGEIGMNLMVIIHRKQAILIDCGVMFPDASMPGIDVIVPNVEFLTKANIEIVGIILTHGHEDHIGAIAYVIDDLKYPPVYSSGFTAALAEDRLREAGKLSRTKVHSVKVPGQFEVGPFKIRSIQVTHSIVDSMGLIIETPVGVLVHSGDFKMDTDPLDGRRIDEDALTKAGKKQPLLLMSDSTNVERPGWSKPEAEVGESLRKIISEIRQGKILIAVFASNIHRIQHIADAATKSGRKLGFVGRAMQSNVEVAIRLGHLKLDRKDIILLSDVKKYRPEEVALIVTGTQAEPRSALYRMSLNDHPDVDILPGDTVIMSSRHIPGNEKNISHLINNLYRREAEVIDSDSAPVHASGHAYQEELKKLIEWVQPKFFLPAHGEYRMLVKHFRLAKSVLPNLRGLVAENGDLLELTANSFEKIGYVPSGKIFLDEGSTDIHEELLRDRRKLAHTGVVVVSLVVDKHTGEILEGPDFDIRGVNDEVDLDGLRSDLLTRFREFSSEARKDDVEVEEEFRRVTRRFFRKANGVKPVVIPLIYEV